MAEVIQTKHCCTCKQIKSFSEFYKNRAQSDSHQNNCKDCKKKQDKEYSQTEKGKIAHQKAKTHYRQTEKYEATRKLYEQSKKCKTARKRYRQGKKSKITQGIGHKRHRIRYPKRYGARIAVSNAIRDGKIPKAKNLKCHYCNEQAEQYHHPSYEPGHWFDVIAICRKCHYHINLPPTS